MSEPKDNKNSIYLSEQLEAFNLDHPWESPELPNFFQRSKIQIQESGNIRGFLEDTNLNFQFALIPKEKLSYRIEAPYIENTIPLSIDFRNNLQLYSFYGGIDHYLNIFRYVEYTPTKPYHIYVYTHTYIPDRDQFISITQVNLDQIQVHLKDKKEEYVVDI